MERDIDKALEGRRLNDLPIQSENIAFKPEEMVSCGKCGKSNPPTRASCFYCSTELRARADQPHLSKINLRKLENWEKGFNIIYLPGGDGDTESDLSGIARLLSIDAEILRLRGESKNPVPIARLESAKEAETAVQNLAQSGPSFSIVSDEFLQADKPPVRLRGLEFSEESVTVITFNTGEKKLIPQKELSIIVPGSFIEFKIESVEKRKKKEIKVLSETETSSDEALIDFYASGDPIGYRIPSKGFDFSCLGAEKGLLAAENMRKLVSKLREFAPQAGFVDDYLAVSKLLDTVWEIDRRKDFHGLQRTGFGRKDFTNVASTNNLRQFTKYSRLQRHLL